MAEPFSWAGIGAALITAGQTIGVVSTVLTVIGWGIAVIVFVVKIIVFLLQKLVWSILMLFLVPFMGIFGFLFYNSSQLIKDLQSDKFEEKEPDRRRIIAATSIVSIIEMVFEEIRMIIVDMIVNITPLIIAFFWLFIPAVIIALIVLVLWQQTFTFFVAVDVIYGTYVVVLNAIAFGLNFVVAYIEAEHETINAFWRFLLELAKALFGIVCSGTPYNGDPEHDCPLLWAFYSVVVLMWDYWWDLVVQFWNLLGEAWVAIGLAICEGQSCDTVLCQKYLGIPSCTWGIEFALRLFVGLITEFATIFYYAFLIILLAILDIIVASIQYFAWLVRSILPPGVGTLLTQLASAFGGGATSLETLRVPTRFLDLKAIILLGVNVVKTIERVLVTIIAVILGVVDTLFCYFFRDFGNCIAPKVCYALLQDINIDVGFNLGLVRISFPIYIPLRTMICINTLHLNPVACESTCDACDLSLGPPIGVVGKVVCNVATTCCNSAYSTFPNFS